MLYAGNHLWLEPNGRTTTDSLAFALQSLWVREVSGREARDHWGGWPADLAPGWHFCYKREDYDSAAYAAAPLHLLLILLRRLRDWRRPLFRLGFIEADERWYFGPGAAWHWNVLAVHRRNLARYRERIPALTWREYVRIFVLRRS